MIALTGLGCQNKSSDLSDGSAGLYVGRHPRHQALSRHLLVPHPRILVTTRRSYSEDVSDVYPTHWDAMRATTLQLRAGPDPGVSTVREIEASVYGD